MSGVRVVALLVRFLSEIGALLAFTLWGFHEAGWFGLLPPIAGAAIWGRWMAPRSATLMSGSDWSHSTRPCMNSIT